MPRANRSYVPDVFYHVTQKCNQGVMHFDQIDVGERYLRFVRDYAAKFSISIAAYCLMSNHVHFVLSGATLESIPKFMQMSQGVTARWFNRSRGGRGHFWQNRYFACVLEPEHLAAAVRYVERNPVAANMVDRAEKYEWSSAAKHCGQREWDLATDIDLGIIKSGNDAWSEWLGESENVQIVAAIRRATWEGGRVKDYLN